MLDKLRRELRISNDAFDEDILDLMEAAKLDLGISGVEKLRVKDFDITDDALIKRAITIYVKANFGWDNPDAERLQQSYLMLKQHLSLSGDYNAV